MVRPLEVKGDPYKMGLQHGSQVSHLQPLIIQAMEHRLARLAERRPEASRLASEALNALESLAPETVAMLRGLAGELGIEFERYLLYALASYLDDRLLMPPAVPPDGCTTWAATARATRDGRSILVKNRDYYWEHLPLQIVIHAEPQGGYRYLEVGSAGSPSVFSSGINQIGLAVADSRVPSRDVGPGLPSYSLMRELLEQHDSVNSALDYLRSAPRMGGSNLILADAKGSVAVFELGHRQFGMVQPESLQLVINTNHYVTPALAEAWVEGAPSVAQGHTLERHWKIQGELLAGAGNIDVAWAQHLMASHEPPRRSICRHGETSAGLTGGTISTAIYLPALRQLVFCHGRPCDAEYQTLEV